MSDFVPASEMRRGTGRTTRMLRAAIQSAASGKYVIVVSMNYDFCRHHQKSCLAMLGAAGYSRRTPDGLNKVMDGKIYHKKGSISFITPNDGFDWREMRPRGAHRSCVVLVDHATIEAAFAPALEMLHRFDGDQYTDFKPAKK